MDGALLVDKEPGITSAGVVAKLKKAFRPDKIGHAGTLDPAASGLLVILLGKATKLQQILLGSYKAYSGVILLGVRTDTDDLEGQIVERDERLAYLSGGALSEIEGKLTRAFTGAQMQMPPQFSAVHVNGKRSYALARAGEKVELAPREITIEHSEFKFLSENRLAYEIRCSKGTYIRSIARDVGSYLQTCGCLESIRRIQSDPFSIEDAKLLSAILEQGVEGSLISMEAMAADLPRLDFDERDCLLLKQGDQRSLVGAVPKGAAITSSYAALFDPQGKFQGLVELTDAGWRVKFMA